MKPRFNGPYVIVEFDDDNVSATIEHLHTKKQMKEHFTNMSIVNFHPKSNCVHSEFDHKLLDIYDWFNGSQRHGLLENKTSD